SGLGAGPRTVVRRLSLASMPHVVDHCFYRQPPGWTDHSDHFPVVPMTEVLELMIAEAAALLPGRVPIGLRDVRALRWLAIEPAVEVTITLSAVEPAALERGPRDDGTAAGELEAVEAVRVSVEGYARGTVLFAAGYPSPPVTSPTTADLPAPAGTPVLPDERAPRQQGPDLYRGRFLFHGPGYQGVEHIDGIASGGVRGRLRVPSASGALLDNAGQLFGYWAMEHLAQNSLLLPQSIADVRFFGPPPVVGEALDCVVRIRAVAERTVVADLELRRADGRCWAIITAWTDRRFANDAVLWTMVRSPELHTVAQPAGEGWLVALDRWSESASRELIVRHYLDAEARARLAALNPRAARGRLLGRIAAQDAVRRWLWDRGAGPVWAIEVGIDNDPLGAPRVRPLPVRAGVPVLDAPWVSLAHKPELAVALVSAAGSVGIDVERIVARAPGVERAALTPSEVDLLDRLAGDDAAARAVWFTRLWAAKEAAAKARGTGLAGRPRQFVVDGPYPAPPVWSSFPASGTAGPPLLLRVTVAGDLAVGDQAAGEPGAGGDRRSYGRWVALRTVDAAGRILPDDARIGSGRPDSAASADRADIPARYVVAWTSPEVEADVVAGRPGGAHQRDGVGERSFSR
ncbi:4'-phosphopantetheinyl transferase superfamily protein, partial [Candidatus Frankia nodulisporulans]